MYWLPFTGSVANTRIMGVLQRIALCYGFASLIAYYMHERVVMILSWLLLLLYWYVSFKFGDVGDPYSILGNAGLKLDT